jgi:TonB family protein
MTRLQKKCLVASVCFHGLTVVVLLATAAFRPEPTITELPVLNLVSLPVLDRSGVSAPSAPAVVPPQPSPPVTHAAPPVAAPPVAAPPVAAPQTHSTEPPKTVVKNTPKPSENRPVTAKAAAAVAPPKHVVTADLTPASSSTKPAPRSAESSAATQAAALAASKKKAQEIAAVFAALDSKVSSKDPLDKVVALPGEDSGEAFVNYRTAVFNAYYQAWKTPEDTSRKMAVADVKIVVARSGEILSCEFVSKSGDAAIDLSVQRALDAVKQLPPFPPKATDTERSFIIRFNLEAKQSAG